MEYAPPEVDPRTTRAAFEQTLNPPDTAPTRRQATFKTVAKRVLFSPWGQAVLGGLVVAIVLTLLNPPMVQSKSETDIQHPARDWKKVAIYAGLTSGLILAVPFGYRYLQRNKV